ncbi:BQ5605_C007g04560 [Microbotryum silenes-dioicae]|uniref:BQ5605_C007g04560 protein n=1 Tax=Microbotryum silenes-dioicae TaxID=796604 RepID=A0A2X0M7E7_9BASI|nr:BQ5605_C007g04560 [Microbotryum silenes-dioicae]
MNQPDSGPPVELQDPSNGSSQVTPCKIAAAVLGEIVPAPLSCLSHGSLDDIYASVELCNTESQVKGESGIELLLCCGDFQVSVD